MGTSLQQQVTQALMRARVLGQPVVIPGAQGIVALPNGQTRMGTPADFGPRTAPSLAASPFGPVPTAGPGVPAGTPGPLAAATGGFTPSPFGDLSLNVGTPMPGTQYNPTVALPPVNVTAPARDPALSQVNPNVQTYAGQPGWGTDPATAARNYRLAHGLGSAQDRMTADQLNTLSLQAAQQGRTFMQPGLQIAPGAANAILAPNLLMTPQAGAQYNALMAGQLPNVHWLASQASNQNQPGGTM